MKIYLDQNIVGHIYQGKIHLPICDDIDWVYSNEHFNEIARGQNTSYLEVFKALKARQIEIILDKFKITDRMYIHEYSCPFERYEHHLKTLNEVEFNDSLFADLLGRLFGADNFDQIRSIPDDFKSQIEKLARPYAELPAEFEEFLEAISSDLREMIETQLNETRPLESLRMIMGTNNGRVGNPKSVNPILEIWEVIKNRCIGQTIDQFFGFDPIDKQGYEKWPTYLGIVGCHTILNFVGYRTDKGIKDPSNIKNIMSDASHIGHAAYCEGVMSEDRRFCDKASAIYSYRNIGTKVICIKFKEQY